MPYPAKKEKGAGLMAIIAGPSKKPMMGDKMGGKMMAEESDEPNEGQKAAAERLASILGVDDPDELASALKDFYDNC